MVGVQWTGVNIVTKLRAAYTAENFLVATGML